MKPEGGFDFAMLYRLFGHYVEPFLTVKPKGQAPIEILLDLGERAFKIGIGTPEGRAVHSYLAACSRLYTDPARKEEMVKVFASVLAEVEFEATHRLNETLIARNSEKNRIRADLLLYSSLAENFVRAFITPIYYFVHAYYQAQKGGAQSPEAYTHVGLVPKINAISGVSIEVPGVDLKTLIKGIDIRIRHGGAGHEHWTPLDNNTVEIKNVSSSTGEVRDKFILTEEELSKKLEDLEKLVWVLRTGFYVFLNNSEMKLPPIRPRTKRGVENFSSTFAEGRVIKLETPFKWDDEKGEIHITVDHEPQKIELPGGQIYMPAGAWDVVQKIDKVSYKEHVLYIARYILGLSEAEKYKIVRITVKNEGVLISDAVYTVSDLINKELHPRDIKSIEGEGIDQNIQLTWVGKLTVPIGYKEEMIKELKEHNPNSDFI